MTANEMDYVVGKVIRQSDTMILQDDVDCGCYRVTCRHGWCFDQPNEKGQDGLHELVSDYSRGGKREALSAARDDFNAYSRFVERCAAKNCEWCSPDADAPRPTLSDDHEPIPCRQCGEKFEDVEGLQSHYARTHDGEEE